MDIGDSTSITLTTQFHNKSDRHHITFGHQTTYFQLDDAFQLPVVVVSAGQIQVVYKILRPQTRIQKHLTIIIAQHLLGDEGFLGRGLSTPMRESPKRDGIGIRPEEVPRIDTESKSNPRISDGTSSAYFFYTSP